MFENSERTEIESLGEFGLIKHISTFFTPALSSTIKGIGDDAAVIDAENQKVLISSDMLIEGIHFDLTYHPLKHLGYKCAIVNFSDICAMNAIPRQLVLNIALSSKFSLEAVEEFYLGVKLACEAYKVDLIGGDTSTSPRGLIVSGTAIGSANETDIVFRSGAKPNDLLVLTGDIGGAYMGLQILKREKQVFLEHPTMQPDLEQNDYIIGRQLKPEARLDVIELLKTIGVVPTSMMDVSDGIASEIQHLGMNSNVGFDIYENKLPIDPQTAERASEFGLNPTIAALNGGEDYELLFTVKPEDFDKIKNNPDLSIIGHATEQFGKYNLITQSGNSFEVKAQGWEHFK